MTHEQRTTAEQLAGTETPYQTSYVYNLSGALIEETYPSGRKVKNTLGLDGELLQVQSKKNANYGFHTYAGSFTYDSSGAVTKMQLGNGRWETASYNNRLQITQIGLGATDNAQDLLKLEYNYTTPSTTNNNGSLREQKITVPTVGQTSGFTATQTYTYDDLNRIQSATEMVGTTETWKQTFTIDRYGNRRFNTASNLTTTLGSCTEAVCNPTISTANNRFTSTGYDYDENGNVMEDAEGRQFTYDAENHQTEVKDSENNVLGEYLYDGEGKRVKKISDTETTIFVYNASGQLVAEYSTQISQTPQVSYLTADHLGSPRVVTNENGVVTSRKDFTAFGEQNYTAQRTETLGYEPDTIRKGYTGYEKDDESGLDFAQARYYNANHGRYTSVDPLTASASIKNPQTFNRYSYVLNSPYKFVDPLGLISESTGACGSRCPGSDVGKTGDGAFTGSDPFGSGSDSDFDDFTPTGNTTLKLEPQSVESLTGKKAEIDKKQVFVQLEWDVTVGNLAIAGTETTVKAMLKGHATQVGEQIMQIGGGINYKLMDNKGNEFKGKEAGAMKKQLQKIAKNSGLDNRSNCHGTTFAGGKYWIPIDSLTSGVLKTLGYENIGDKPRQKDDVGLYNDGGYVHSVRFNADTGTVRGKGGVEPYRSSVKLADAWNKPGTLEVWRKIKK